MIRVEIVLFGMPYLLLNSVTFLLALQCKSTISTFCVHGYILTPNLVSLPFLDTRLKQNILSVEMENRIQLYRLDE